MHNTYDAGYWGKRNMIERLADAKLESMRLPLIETVTAM